ncbi:MAG: hypothetical protein ACI9D0_001493 [Bacteroidia bacterium]|jgi:hypothetical protein
MADKPKKVDKKAPYTIHKSGLWNSSHVFERGGETIGTLAVKRGGPLAMIAGSHYTPVEGENITIERDPGLLRAQFGCWSQVHGGQGREWLGSSIRYNLMAREVTLHGGQKPYRVTPSRTFGIGWDMHAPKTGLVAEFRKKGNTVEVTLHRRVDFFLLLLAYHTICTSWMSSLLSGPEPTPPIM